MHMRHIVVCGLFRSTVTTHIISKTARFSKKKELMNITFVFWFSLQLSHATFLILRWNERDMIKNVY